MNIQDLLRQGISLSQTGQKSQALECFNEIVKELGTFTPAIVYYNRGIVYGDMGLFNEAINDFSKAIEIGYLPKPFDTFSETGFLVFCGGNKSTAISYLSDAYCNRGYAYANKGLYDEAIEDYTKAIQMNPEPANAYYNRGVAYGVKGLYEEAVEDLTKAIQINPRYAKAYNHRGSIYCQKGLCDEAIEDCTKAIEINPELILAYCCRGNAYAKKDLPDEAIEDFTKAIQINPKHALAYHDRGVAYLMKRLSELCISDWKKAVDLGEEIARQNLKKFFNIDY